MKQLGYPITKILLPYDGSPSARNALELAASLSKAGGQAITGLTLLKVIGGGYLARHIQNVDLRTIRMDQDKDWQRIRRRHREQEVLPLLEEGRDILRSLGVTVPIEVRITEGRISEEIIRLTRQEDFSTIIMGHPGLPFLQGLFSGSVTSGLLPLAENVTVYLAPQEPLPAAGHPVFPILLPVDGSTQSLNAIRQAAALAQAMEPPRSSLTLLHVVDIDALGLAIHEGAQDLLAAGEKILAAARALLLDAGLEGRFQEKLLGGEPAQTIVHYAETGGFPLIMMGSKGHSTLAQMLVGSVSSTVVYTSTHTAVAVVYG
jgi:nucleotide-binding universal stress UspA family protein|uniref:Universal stress protein n=1 Tax=Desulfobacca acetoxidans TaxID=60893 RepID=A0A7V6A3F6_9BACT